jgi:uncharacterized protein (TIGR02246 family)
MDDFVATECAIRQLHARYADAVWRKDYQAFGGCFAPDAEWRIAGMVLRGRTEITQTVENLLSHFQRVLMLFQTPILDVRDGQASARTYSLEQYFSASTAAQAGGPPGGISIGTYYERYRKIDGQWLFSWRLFQLQYMGAADGSGTLFSNTDFGPPPALPDLDATTTNDSGLGS